MLENKVNEWINTVDDQKSPLSQPKALTNYDVLMYYDGDILTTVARRISLACRHHTTVCFSISLVHGELFLLSWNRKFETLQVTVTPPWPGRKALKSWTVESWCGQFVFCIAHYCLDPTPGHKFEMTLLTKHDLYHILQNQVIQRNYSSALFSTLFDLVMVNSHTRFPTSTHYRSSTVLWASRTAINDWNNIG
jgi:hypothetical protein